MVRFPLQEGTVIFTSFHNEKQNNETELKLLKYLVFTAVTANVQLRTERSMGGFSKSRDSLISVSQGTPPSHGPTAATLGPISVLYSDSRTRARG